MTNNRDKALEGIRVLDMSRVLAGPFCSMILADLGAEVIKVETPWGDDSRMFGPFYGEHSAYYRLFNRSKKGITVDLKTDQGRDTILGLAARSDVVVENFRPGVMGRLGISAQTLREINPRLIVTSISGFGQEGSLNGVPAYDLVAQAMSGLMSVTGWPGERPTRTGVSLGDLIPGLYGAVGTLGALMERQSSGKGQHVDVAMYDSLVSILESVAMRSLYETEEPVAVGNDHAMTVPFSTYAAKNGEVVIAVSNDKLFSRLASALGMDHLMEDERFATYNARVEHREETRQVLEGAIADMPVETVVAKLREHGVPTSHVASVQEAIRGSYAQERGVLFEEPDGFRTLASPLRLSGSAAPSPAPNLGEHNREIKKWLTEPPRNGNSDSRTET